MGYKLRFRGYRLRFRGYDPSPQGISATNMSDTMKIYENDDVGQPLTADVSFDGMDSPQKEDISARGNLNNLYDSKALSPADRQEDEGNKPCIYDDSDHSVIPSEVTLRDDEVSVSSIRSIQHFEHYENPDNPIQQKESWSESFLCLRLSYLLVTLVIMLADGLQGTHLYVLYEGYGFSVASLYCLGFVTGGLMSPITGPLVDKLGRKKSALLYCILEISINQLEQYPVLGGLIISRMVGGITTNLLSTVFDTWLDTEYRRRGFDKEKYEIIMRDSVVVSNLAAIGSGYLAHMLAEKYGAVGPFQGAVTFTCIALIVVALVWTENYGCYEHEVKSISEFLNDAVAAFKSDHKVLKVGVIQGLTCASIQIFIFLWSPALRHFAQNAPKGSLGLDSNGEPAYGLIFGSFMAAGVVGGVTAPWVRKFTSYILSPLGLDLKEVEVEGEQMRPMAVELLSAGCYILSAALLLFPCLLPEDGTHSFSICLGAFLVYEYLVGLYLPCEGVIRSLYFPSEGRASIMTLPRIIVNAAVSMGVITTNFITMRSAFSSIFLLMVVSAGLQLSLISEEQWSLLFSNLDMWQNKVLELFYGASATEEPLVSSLDDVVLDPVKKRVSTAPSTASIDTDRTSCSSSFVNLSSSSDGYDSSAETESSGYSSTTTSVCSPRIENMSVVTDDLKVKLE